MNRILRQFVFVALVLATAINSPAPTAVTAPPGRTIKTPFAPKPHKGNDIFKGEAEVWLANAHQQLCGLAAIDDEAINSYVTRVGENLARYSTRPEKEYRFFVIDYDYPDAFSIGGGRIYVTVGLLKLMESEDQLAGILAHEIAHDAFGHIGKTVTRQLFWMTGIKRVQNAAEVKSALLTLHAKYADQPLAQLGDTMLGLSRLDELEADRAGFYNSYKAGYNPRGLSEVLQLEARHVKEEQGKKRYWRDEFLMLLFVSHPPDAQRFLALSWETNFVQMPPSESRVKSAAFDEMKKNVADE